MRSNTIKIRSDPSFTERGTNMTIPAEELASITMSKKFLFKLLDKKETPRVPKKVRDEAARCLRHFPYTWVTCELWEGRIKTWDKMFLG